MKMCMKTRQNSIIKQTLATVIGWTLLPCLVASVNANSVTVTDVTDWDTTPGEAVNANIPYLGYNGGIEAGINTLLVNTGQTGTTYNGFCIDPFHWTLIDQPSSAYSMVPLVDAPKAPAELNAFTTTEIEELWGKYYSPTMSSTSAAGLQIAIWELVSSNAVASDGLALNQAFSLSGGSDYGASSDLASLANYNGPIPTLMALTGPGQDYVIQVQSVPDGGATLIMLALPLSVLVLTRRALLKTASQSARLQAIPVRRIER